MNSNQSHAIPTEGVFLVHEADGLVCERLRTLLRAEGYSSCVVDDIRLFHEIRARLPFAGFVVGVERAQDVEELKLTRDVAPLLLVAPDAAGGGHHYGVAVPQASIIDRSLRDPDALRRALSPRAPAAPADAALDSVRDAFEPFGVSERQLEVLRRALLGDSAAEIAGRLYISELTVRNHLHAIYERVGVSGRRELQGRFLQTLLEA
jgi:DNA-binding CsgD family transcriptional regulator